MKRMLERFKVSEQNVRWFTDIDVFNKNNVLEGYLCASDGPHYGSMLLTKINGVETEQWVHATPKLSYPFDRADRWNFPKALDLKVYNKLDGTNITAYTYIYNGQKFVTYKLRMKAVVANSGKWGQFLDMLNEMLAKYKESIEQYLKQNEENLSFELFGARNKHLMLYAIPLELNLLFRIDRKNGDILPPVQIGNVPLPIYYECDRNSNYVQLYKWMQEEDEKKIDKTDMGYKGEEGRVWYLKLENGKWKMFKMKPESVEAVHWAGGLGKNMIKATALNVLENYPEITFERVKELLLETCSERDIEVKADLIKSIIVETIAEIDFEQRVLDEYKKIPVSIWKDKVFVMREMSKKFQGSKMSWVFWIVTNKG